MWWPFKRSPATDGEPFRFPHERVAEQAAEQIEVLRAWRAVGEEFEYLGRRMAVVRHSVVESWPGSYWIYMKPELTARYADDRGEIHTIVFGGEEALQLAQLRK